VNNIATIPIRITVTTWPLPVTAAAPNNGIGAVGWMRTIPYRMSADNPSVRFSPGSAGAVESFAIPHR
jgi:hypothetical protein